MIEAEADTQCKEQDSEHEVGRERPAYEAYGNKHDGPCDRQGSLTVPSENGIADVAAVQLPYWEQVQAGCKQPEPGAHRDGVRNHVLDFRPISKNNLSNPAKDERLTKVICTLHGASGYQLGVGNPDEERRKDKSKPSQGTGDSDIEEGPPVVERRSDPDERAERSGEGKWKRNEVGWSALDPVILTGEEVAKFVRE